MDGVRGGHVSHVRHDRLMIPTMTRHPAEPYRDLPGRPLIDLRHLANQRSTSGLEHSAASLLREQRTEL